MMVQARQSAFTHRDVATRRGRPAAALTQISAVVLPSEVLPTDPQAVSEENLPALPLGLRLLTIAGLALLCWLPLILLAVWWIYGNSTA